MNQTDSSSTNAQLLTKQNSEKYFQCIVGENTSIWEETNSSEERKSILKK